MEQEKIHSVSFSSALSLISLGFCSPYCISCALKKPFSSRSSKQSPRARFVAKGSHPATLCSPLQQNKNKPVKNPARVKKTNSCILALRVLCSPLSPPPRFFSRVCNRTRKGFEAIINKKNNYPTKEKHKLPALPYL